MHDNTDDPEQQPRRATSDRARNMAKGGSSGSFSAGSGGWLTDTLRATPVVTIFVLLNIAVYLVMVLQAVYHGAGLSALQNPFQDRENLGWELLLSAGHMSAFDQWWRPLTAAIVHLDITHLIFNMLAIYFIGQAVERHYRHKVTIGMMLAAAGAGALACLIFQPQSPMGGASTVAFGLMAMLFGLKIEAREQMVSAVTMVVIYFAWTLFTPGVSLWGHVGGFIGGAIVYLVARIILTKRPTVGRLKTAGAASVAIGLALLVGAGAVGVFDKFPGTTVIQQVIETPSPNNTGTANV